MEVITDTSSIVAVILNEPTKPALLKLTQGADFVAPSSVHWEIIQSAKRLNITVLEV